MRVYDLGRDDLVRLKQLYMKAVMEPLPTYGELCAADEIIPDGEIMSVYGFVDIPEGFYMPKRDEEQYKHLIKINLSCSPGDEGIIEGIWAFVDDRAKEAYDNDDSGSYFHCVLDNDAFNWRGLYAGCKVKIMTRGELLPIAPYKWLSDRYEYIGETL